MSGNIKRGIKKLGRKFDRELLQRPKDAVVDETKRLGRKFDRELLQRPKDAVVDETKRQWDSLREAVGDAPADVRAQRRKEEAAEVARIEEEEERERQKARRRREASLRAALLEQPSLFDLLSGRSTLG